MEFKRLDRGAALQPLLPGEVLPQTRLEWPIFDADGTLIAASTGDPNPINSALGGFPIVAGNLLPCPGPGCGTTGPVAGIFAGTPNTALVLGPTRPEDRQLTNTFAVYASGEYPLLDNLTLLGGVRYTEEDKKGGVCGNDGGDGSWAQVAYTLQSFYDPPSQSTPNAGDNAAVASPAGTLSATDK